MKSKHVTLGSVCYRLQYAKILAHQWSQVIKDPMWSAATELVLIALMRKLQKERGKNWGLSDLRLLAQSSNKDLIEVIRTYQPKLGLSLESESRTFNALMLNVHMSLSGVIA
jgi:hypothetical protein